MRGKGKGERGRGKGLGKLGKLLMKGFSTPPATCSPPGRG